MPRRVKRSNWFELLDLRIDRATAVPIFRQLYSEIRRVILSNVLPAGSRVPSTRQLAVRLAVSRTSVVTAYEQLLMEGYIVGRVGSGTYVSTDLPEPIEIAGITDGPSATSNAPRPISAGGVRCTKFAQDNVLLDNAPVHIPGNAPFNTGRCSIDGRTLDAWRKLTCRRLSRVDPLHLGYSDPQGLLELRRAIAEYLRAARAVRCEPDQIVVIAGAQQAIDLTLKILVDTGEAVWVEDPCYPAAYAALAVAGAKIVPVPVDDHGLIISQGIAAWPEARAVYVTPSHQYPLGVVMSMARRLELLAWARNVGAWIIEDDYDTEFRYAGRPLASLQGLDDSHRVIYVGTLSKVLFPGLRVGYAVVPHDLVDAFTAARLLADRNPPTLEQSVVADFINQGFFTSHIRRMRMKYRDARDTLVEAARQQLAEFADVDEPGQGMQLVARLKGAPSDVAVAEEARKRGIITRPVSRMFIQAPPVSALLLGFTGYELYRIRSAVTRLARSLEVVAHDKDERRVAYS